MITLFMNASSNAILVTVADVKQFLKRINGDSKRIGKRGSIEGQSLTYYSQRKSQRAAGPVGWVVQGYCF